MEGRPAAAIPMTLVVSSRRDSGLFLEKRTERSSGSVTCCGASKLWGVHGRPLSPHLQLPRSQTALSSRGSRNGHSRPCAACRARDKQTGVICALKRIKMEKEKEGFPLTSIREINILLSFQHKNIVDVSEVVVGDSLDQIFMVMEFMEHDLKGLMDDMTQPFTVAEVTCPLLHSRQSMERAAAALG